MSTMTTPQHEHLLTTTPPATRSAVNQRTSSPSLTDDDDHQARTPRPYAAVPAFSKTERIQMSRKESVLTQMFSTSSEVSTEDEAVPTVRRGFSTTSTWSNPSLTDDNGMTSPGTRTTTPSPPPPANLMALPPVFNTKPFEHKSVVIKDHDTIDPLEKPTSPAGEQAVEAALGRKRLCMFACAKKDAPRSEPIQAEPAPKKEEPTKRKCMLTFACPTKQVAKEASPPAPAVRKTSIGRRPSPAPSVIKISNMAPSPSRLLHSSTTSLQSTLKNNEKTTARSRRLSTAGAADTEPTERFCMSNEQRTEDDDWMKERTCHRSRLTVDDTLTKELNLRKLGKEAEEEDEIEVEEELDNEGADDDEDDAEDDENAGDLTANSEDHDSDDGFDSDDEAGLEDSGEEDDDGSDYEWWAPGRSTAATSFEHLDQMHFSRQRNFSGSSIGSISSTRAISGEKRKPLRKRASIPIKRAEPDLPDSTDFVCGTLDEDRPMEEAYKQEIEKRRAAQHVPCPQDIDPTFPTSDPEMDEEDDEDVFENHEVEESDMHVEGVFGNFEAHEEAKDARGRPRKSPAPSPPKRMKSPAPKRNVHRSPPPRKLFGTSPSKRTKSPAPAPRLRSPPPTRRASFAKSPKQHPAFMPIALAERPHGGQITASSVPRRPNMQQRYRVPSPVPDLENTDGEERAPRPARTAIDIVKGLEKKRQFRREKLYRKYCWQRANGESKRREERKCPPGKGAEKMREMGLELAGKWRPERKGQYSEREAQHILSL